MVMSTLHSSDGESNTQQIFLKDTRGPLDLETSVLLVRLCTAQLRNIGLNSSHGVNTLATFDRDRAAIALSIPSCVTSEDRTVLLKKLSAIGLLQLKEAFDAA